MNLAKCIHQLKAKGCRIVRIRRGINRQIIEVTGKPPSRLPYVTEVKNGKQRVVRPAKMHNCLVFFIEPEPKLEGEAVCH